jgi:hypothetical protein
MPKKVLGPVRSDGKIISYQFPLSHDYDYAKQLSYDALVGIRTALASDSLDEADYFSHCHARILNTVAMEYLVASVK